MWTLIRRRRIAKRQHHAAARDDTWIDFSAYSISRKTISEKWAMLDAGVPRLRLFGTAKHQPLLTF
jgi:hypothetical protein